MNYFERFNRTAAVFTKTWTYLKLSEQPGNEIRTLKQKWAQDLLSHLNINLTVRGEIGQESPLLFIGNHISYLDIPLLIHLIPDISFVSKKEVSRWPVIGKAAEKIDTIFVSRECRSSRKSARLEISQSLSEQKKRVAVFPSGTTCLHEKKEWKKGIFEIAFEYKVPVQPFRISYKPLRPVAYIDDDTFLFHLMNLSAHQKIEAEIEFHPPVRLKDPLLDRLYWHRWTQSVYL